MNKRFSQFTRSEHKNYDSSKNQINIDEYEENTGITLNFGELVKEIDPKTYKPYK